MSSQRTPEGAAAAAGAPGVSAIPPAKGTLVPFRLGGELRVAVVVKAAFVIVPEGPMALAEPEDVITTEVHLGNSLARSVRLTPDTAPRLPRADVLLTGHACAPEGQTVRWMPVRLAVFRERALVDKTIYVYGDDGGSVPFDRIPLVYERAHGGLGQPENPLGTGTLELSSKPNLVHPERADQVACFAPIARTWPARRKLAGAIDRKALDAPIPDIPAGFDFTYYQAAPVDQRPPHLHGDEWLVLEGMSPTAPRIRSRLPTARAHARLHGLPGTPEGAPLELAADTLRIEADRMGCTVVWRADFAVPSEEALAGLRVVVAVETEAMPVVWPDEASPAPPPEPVPVSLPQEVIELDADALIPLSTVTLEAAPADEAPPAPIVPFVPASAPGGALPPRASTLVLPAERLGDTLAITADVTSMANAPSLPFARAVPTAPPPQWAPPPEPPLSVAAEPSPVARYAITDEATAEAPAAPAPIAARETALGIELDNTTPLALGVVPWGLTPARDCLAVIAKATCDLVPGEAAALRAQADPLGGEISAEGLAGRVLRPSDLAPFKVRADVVATGHAHVIAPGGSAPSMDIEFKLGHEGNAFCRKIRVFGDRRWERQGAAPAPSAPEHFMAMSVSYDRAFGGAGFDANPAGVGLVDRWRHARALPPLPNLEDPDALLRLPSQRPAPACFAPLPLAWAASRGPERRSPWARFPEDLDWTAHQIAPPAQRLAFLRGDEPFALTGMHRTHAVLEGRLPGVRPRCFASARDRFVEVTLRLDTVHIDADAMKVTLVWRGALPVASEAQPDVKSLHLVMEKVGEEGMSLDDARARFAG
jgi:hypothetical protein